MPKESPLPIEELKRSVEKRFPNAEIGLDRPRKVAGTWFLDIVFDQHSVVVQWQEEKGFGVSSSPDKAYGEGADEVYKDEEAAYGRVVSLLLSKSFTSPPPAVSLKELRKEMGLSQADIAEIIGRQQGEISKIERRSDVRVSTLAAYAKAIQAEMQIVFRRSDGKISRIQLEDALEPGPSSDSTPDR